MTTAAGSTEARRRAGTLLAVLAAALFAPLAALATFSPHPREPNGCHCPVKMACCEAGLCHGGEPDMPTPTPSWSGCRDEAPQRDAGPPPSSAFDGALLRTSGLAGEAPAGEAGLVAAGRGPSFPPAPPAPPPRRLRATR